MGLLVRLLPAALLAVLLAALLAGLLAVAAAAEVRWVAPDEVQEGHPVHAAWAAVESEDPLVLQGHATADVRILLDGEVVFESASIHEHDGLHTLVYTPPRPGSLLLEATPPGDEPVVHEILVVDARPADGVPAKEWGLLSLEAVREGQRTRLHLEGYHSVAVEHWQHGAQWDVRDAAGRLLLAAGAVDQVDAALPSEAVRAVLMSQPGRGITFGARVLEAEVEGRHQEALPAVLPATSACPSSRLKFDPESLVPGELVFQEWTDIRVVALSLEPTFQEPVAASLLRREAVGGTTLWSATSDSLLPSFTFRTPGPGEYMLDVRDRVGCKAPIRVVAMDGSPLSVGAPPEPGRVEADMRVEDGSLHASLAAVDGAGAALDHYEFDVRVVHVDAWDGRLVWQGKLHGHGGAVAFALHGLAPGDHEVHVYPSPQGAGTPPVAAEGAEGFLYPFAVAGEEEAPLAAEASGTAVVLVAAGALAVALRRRARA